ncbi:MAG: hypothetical protein LPK45_07455, partial [Bacteroidota bacterium]|nr:hypothetical protein [Bacteroidota bacterium]MDX5430910.1 hypothetical protein [Bacteroidota bacterium]MDX5469657.1 hypothetical protein [Bacteroidota bacterium]
MKKLNQYLLVKYPLIWNTRAHIVFPIILVLHLLFYAAAYYAPMELSSMQDNWLLRVNDVITFSILVSVLLIILWLVYFLRNNPLKALYPLSGWAWFGQFLIILVTFYSSSTFFLTYQQGLYDRADLVASEVELLEELETANLAVSLIAFDKEEFDIYRNCDTLQARTERERAYDEAWDSTHLPTDEKVYYYEPYLTDVYFPPSYLHYCTRRFSLSQLDQSAMSISPRRSRAWLMNGNKDSVQMVFARFEELLKKYQIAYYFDFTEHVDRLFESAPNFEIDTFFYT